MDCSNNSSDIEILVDNQLSLCTILQISDVNPNDSHVRFGKYFDYIRLGSQYNVVENVCFFNDFLNNFGSNKRI